MTKVTPIPGFDGYFASRDGRIWSKRQMGSIPGTNGPLRELKPSGGRYLKVELRLEGCYRTRMVHTLILLTFVGACPKGQECRHKNGVKMDNRLSNLQWGTRIQNAHDKIIHGTQVRGDIHGRAKLTDDQCRDILLRVGDSQRQLAKEFGVSQAQISRLRQGKRRAHLQGIAGQEIHEVEGLEMKALEEAQ